MGGRSQLLVNKALVTPSICRDEENVNCPSLGWDTVTTTGKTSLLNACQDSASAEAVTGAFSCLGWLLGGVKKHHQQGPKGIRGPNWPRNSKGSCERLPQNRGTITKG